MKNKIKVPGVILFIVCVLVAAVMLIPFIWMLSASFKQNTEIFRKPFQWLPEIFRIENYTRVWTQVNTRIGSHLLIGSVCIYEIEVSGKR